MHDIKIKTAAEHDAQEVLDIQRSVLAEEDFLMTTVEELTRQF